MNNTLLARYMWLIDLLDRYGSMTRENINRHWMRSPLSDGNPMPQRTFFHYRRGIEEVFNIDIACNRDGEYHIAGKDSGRHRRLTDLLLDSYTVNSALSAAPEVSARIEVEDVPSARHFLPRVVEAIRDSECISFTYTGFNRSRAESGIIFHPYFLKRYKQRWYVAGLREHDNSLRTYALDRMTEMHPLDRHFEMPDSPTLDDLFGQIVGVTSSHGRVHEVRIQATPMQAKYLRALPLHSSQKERPGDDGNPVFTYRLKLNYELVHELMAMGDGIKVLAPKELKIMIVEELRKTLSQYL